MLLYTAVIHFTLTVNSSFLQQQQTVDADNRIAKHKINLKMCEILSNKFHMTHKKQNRKERVLNNQIHSFLYENSSYCHIIYSKDGNG